MLIFAALACIFFAVASGISVDDFGAIENVASYEVAVHNSNAFYKAVLAANSNADDRTVVFPAGKVYYLANSSMDGLHDMKIQVDATVRFNDEINSYPLNNGGGRYAFWYFTNCESIQVSGSGSLDGQGLKWWRLCYLGKFLHYRPQTGFNAEFNNLLYLHFNQFVLFTLTFTSQEPTTDRFCLISSPPETFTSKTSCC